MLTTLQNAPAMNPTFQITETQGSETHATVVIEPLEQGYGHTLGNALRRVMLSSLPGAAITTVRIAGVDHQYSTLEGMTEDVVELILNLRQLRIKAETENPGTLRLKVSGPATVTAADIDVAAGYTIMNTDQLIVTLAKGATLDLEMTVEAGLGYVSAVERKTTTLGEIPVDSLFSPVVKVSYNVEATRVGRKTDYDKIVFEIDTNGTIAPKDAVIQAAQILARQFAQVVEPVGPALVAEQPKMSPEEAEVMKLTVEELDLPTRIANALRKGGFKTVGDLSGAPKNVIAKVKNLGEKSVDVINEALMKKGVTLGE